MRVVLMLGLLAVTANGSVTDVTLEYDTPGNDKLIHYAAKTRLVISEQRIHQQVWDETGRLRQDVILDRKANFISEFDPSADTVRERKLTSRSFRTVVPVWEVLPLVESGFVNDNEVELVSENENTRTFLVRDKITVEVEKDSGGVIRQVRVGRNGNWQERVEFDESGQPVAMFDSFMGERRLMEFSLERREKGGGDFRHETTDSTSLYVEKSGFQLHQLPVRLAEGFSDGTAHREPVITTKTEVDYPSDAGAKSEVVTSTAEPATSRAPQWWMVAVAVVGVALVVLVVFGWRRVSRTFEEPYT